jgi:hypothetical protein
MINHLCILSTSCGFEARSKSRTQLITKFRVVILAPQIVLSNFKLVVRAQRETREGAETETHEGKVKKRIYFG